MRGFHDRAIAQQWRRRSLRHPKVPTTPGAGSPRTTAATACFGPQEDLARRTDVPDAEIAQNKRAIDRLNQQRNDAVECIDEALLARAAAVPLREDAWHNSETAGAMIDRLSILALKVHAMGSEARRADASDAHRAACAEKLGRLALQRGDLARCLDTLLARAAEGARSGACTGSSEGRAFWRVYRQYKHVQRSGARIAPARIGRKR